MGWKRKVPFESSSSSPVLSFSLFLVDDDKPVEFDVELLAPEAVGAKGEDGWELVIGEIWLGDGVEFVKGGASVLSSVVSPLEGNSVELLRTKTDTQYLVYIEPRVSREYRETVTFGSIVLNAEQDLFVHVDAR